VYPSRREVKIIPSRRIILIRKEEGIIMKRKFDIGGDIIFNFIFCGLAFFILYQTSAIRPESALFPKMLGYVLLALNFFLILPKFFLNTSNLIKNKKTGTEERRIRGKIKNQKYIYEIYPFFIILFCILFLLGCERIGFDLSAFGIILATMLLINREEAFSKFYFAIIIPLVLILIFRTGLGLRIPLFIEKFFG